MNDTLRMSAQAHEDTVIARLEAGLIPGAVSHPLDGLVDVEMLYAEAKTIGRNGVYLCRISREMALRGLEAGAAYGNLIAGMPENARGCVMLSFDGWANDPRELHQIPEVVDFCNGMLYGADPTNNPDPGQPEMARKVLPYLLDEVTLLDAFGQEAWEIAGRNWLVSVAHASVIYRGLRRNAGLAMGLCKVFLE